MSFKKIKEKNIDILYLYFVIILFLTIFVSMEKVNDNDLWWHLKNGEYIIKNNIIPHKDVFSYYGIENNLDWIAHEWLFDVFIYFVYSFFGFYGIGLFQVLLSAIIITILFVFTKDNFKYSYKKTYTIFFFVIGIVLAITAAPRPHMISFVLFILTLHSIYQIINKKNKKHVFLIPLYVLFWVNIHGGSSSLPFVLLSFYIFFGLFDFKIFSLYNKKLEKTTLFYLVETLFLSLLTSLINPYGYKILLYPYINMLDNTMLSFISEWQSPNFHTIDGVFFFIVLFTIITYLYLFASNRLLLVEYVLMICFMYMALKMIRQISYFSFYSFYVITKNMLVVYKKESETKNNNFGILIITIGLGLVLFFNIFTFYKKPLDLSTYPSEKMISVIKQKNVKRIFNLYDWGGFLIFNDIKPFIDGRADIFSKYTLNDTNDILSVYKDWEPVFNKYNFDSLLIAKDSSLNIFVSKYKKDIWEKVYEDEVSVFYILK